MRSHQWHEQWIDDNDGNEIKEFVVSQYVFFYLFTNINHGGTYMSLEALPTQNTKPTKKLGRSFAELVPPGFKME